MDVAPLFLAADHTRSKVSGIDLSKAIVLKDFMFMFTFEARSEVAGCGKSCD